MKIEELIAVNKKYSDGTFINRGNLEYALSIPAKTNVAQLAHITRALLSGHAFKDGNKRTLITILLEYCREIKIEPSRERIQKTILRLTKENDIKKLITELKYALK